MGLDWLVQSIRKNIETILLLQRSVDAEVKTETIRFSIDLTLLGCLSLHSETSDERTNMAYSVEED